LAGHEGVDGFLDAQFLDDALAGHDEAEGTGRDALGTSAAGAGEFGEVFGGAEVGLPRDDPARPTATTLVPAGCVGGGELDPVRLVVVVKELLPTLARHDGGQGDPP